MPIDGYFLERMVLELKPKIANAKLRKIKSPSKTSFLFEFYQLGQSYYLLLDLNLSSPNLRLTNDLVDSETSNFVIHLKKHLLNAQLNDITQYKKDRILKFSFTVVDTFLGFVNRSLIFEVMGKSSNLILLDENDIIIDSYNKHFNETKRSILPKLIYEVFPQDKKDFNFNDLAYLLSPEDLFKNYMGFSKDLSNYIFNHKINIDQEPTNPTIYISNRNVFHAIDLKLTGDKKQFNTLSELLNYYYAIEPVIQNYLLEISNKEVKKLESKKQKLSEDYQINQDYDQYRVLADEIYASGFDLKSHYSSFKGYELDYSMTLNENVQKLYSKYTKQNKLKSLITS
jgi:predicted ribosome quality control (RQC) complex YloA/Tae2 family protein